jgi:anti-sigma factor RsiW
MSNYPTVHITDSELLQAADGELSNRRTAEIQAHLVSCWSCRARSAEIESAIAGFIQTYEHEKSASMPSAEAARFQLEGKLARLAANTRPTTWERASGFLFTGRRLTYAGGVLAIVLLYFIAGRVGTPELYAGLLPDARLTPGAARIVTVENVCSPESPGNIDEVQAIPASVAHRVFAKYGIRNPAPRKYEVDYLITPALGGSIDIQNLWPQPYDEGRWNSHVKDALEDQLRVLVCAGMLDLPTAQRDISADWIAAYRKYFRTREPLEIHAGFALDPPWE